MSTYKLPADTSNEHTLPESIGGYQHLAPDTVVKAGDIYVENGKPMQFVEHAIGALVSVAEKMTAWNVYRRIPVAKQGGLDHLMPAAAAPAFKFADDGTKLWRGKDGGYSPSGFMDDGPNELDVATHNEVARKQEEEVQAVTLKAATYDDGKPPLASLPPEGILAVARVQAYGKKKYGDDENYRKGMEAKRQMSCVLRHVFKYLAGEDNDKESGEPHLAHAATRLMFAIQNIADGTMIDDRYKGAKK